MELIIAEISKLFGKRLDLHSLKLLKGGHINSSFFIKDDEQSFLLQSINTQVFTNWNAIDENLEMIQEKALPLGLVPRFYKASTSKYHVVVENKIYRLSEFIENQPIKPSLENSFAVAQQFALFSKFLSETISKKKWSNPIDHFHSLSFRWNAFEQSLHSASEERINAAQDLIVGFQIGKKVLKQFSFHCLPQRITHNDAKLTNILSAVDTNQLVIIDLDTVMPGKIIYDLGDLVRTFTPSKEEGDFSNRPMKINHGCYDALLSGYREGWGGKLTADENRLLPYAGIYMSWIIGLRFLTDYLLGDIYFKTEIPNHNLLRAQNQLELVTALLEA